MAMHCILLPYTLLTNAVMDDIRRILVIDDNPDHLLIAKLILERRGYEVLTLNDCRELIEKLQLFQPGLIFMDHHMPVMTGLEATQLIKSNDSCKHIPVIFFTSREDVQELAALAGADHWLSKPFTIDEMIKVTKQFL